MNSFSNFKIARKEIIKTPDEFDDLMSNSERLKEIAEFELYLSNANLNNAVPIVAFLPNTIEA